MPAGRERWIRARCVPDLHFDGTVKGEYVVGHDITDLKQAQDALAAREGQLRAIMDGVPAPVAYIDRDERCHYVNRTFLQFFGLTPEQVAVMRLRDVVGHGIYQSAQAMLTRAMEGESTAFDRLVPGANGVRRWMTIRVVPDASPVGRGARRVRADERHPRPEAGAGGVARVGGASCASSWTTCRRACRTSTATTATASSTATTRNGWARAARSSPAARSPRCVGNERANAAGAAARPRADRARRCPPRSSSCSRTASERWESVHYAPHRDGEGNVVGIYAVHTDIHDQKRNEDELRRANWMLSSHISNTPLAVLEWDRDFRLVRWSPQAENIFGWRSDEILGMPLADSPLVHEDDREGVRRPGRRA